MGSGNANSKFQTGVPLTSRTWLEWIPTGLWSSSCTNGRQGTVEVRIRRENSPQFEQWRSDVVEQCHIPRGLRLHVVGRGRLRQHLNMTRTLRRMLWTRRPTWHILWHSGTRCVRWTDYVHIMTTAGHIVVVSAAPVGRSHAPVHLAHCALRMRQDAQVAPMMCACASQAIQARIPCSKAGGDSALSAMMLPCSSSCSIPPIPHCPFKCRRSLSIPVVRRGK